MKNTILWLITIVLISVPFNGLAQSKNNKVNAQKVQKANNSIIPDRNFSSRWKFKRDYGDTLIYTSSNKVQLTVKYQTTPFNSHNFTKQLISKQRRQKKRILASIGIKNWKVHQSHVKKGKEKTYIHLQGSYTDPSGQKVLFVEHHFYSAFRHLQLLLTHNKSQTLLRSSSLAHIKDFRIKYGF